MRVSVIMDAAALASLPLAKSKRAVTPTDETTTDVKLMSSASGAIVRRPERNCVASKLLMLPAATKGTVKTLK